MIERCCLLIDDVLDESTDNIHVLCETPKQLTRRKEILLSTMYSKSRKIVNVSKEPRTRGEHKNNFRVIRPNLQSYKKGPFYRGALLWNDLSEEAQAVPDKFSFKTCAKKVLGSNMKGMRNKLLKLRRNRKTRARAVRQPSLYYHIFPPRKRQGERNVRKRD